MYVLCNFPHPLRQKDFVWGEWKEKVSITIRGKDETLFVVEDIETGYCYSPDTFSSLRTKAVKHIFSDVVLTLGSSLHLISLLVGAPFWSMGEDNYAKVPFKARLMEVRDSLLEVVAAPLALIVLLALTTTQIIRPSRNILKLSDAIQRLWLGCSYIHRYVKASSS